ncbi:fatty acid hydroxylase [Aristophania vespae]|uniref:Fatty acid hydroxylase n=1 Tax=Aristophania vespae TaxID=2697033 RepID=A0A6P1NFB9_9PROT|nr:sterol desaturase family protein [Aristophania vespae]QHI95134.1 fatty acid hydroxylase [Aristophania vespae]UMM64347.1 hypothetical protein DM15PD_13610 [Aristophania vespae]
MTDFPSKPAKHEQISRYKKISGKAPPIRIFKRDWMEAFTLISFRTFLTFCIIGECLALYVTYQYSHNWLGCLWRFAVGIIVWEFFEYVMHRYIFHFKSNNPYLQKMVYIFHGNHHIQPNHPLRTIMPLIVTLPVGIIIWSVSIWCGGAGFGSAFFAGFFLGYALYDTIHYATHNFRMKSFPLSWLKKHHLLHHYMTEEHNYAISLPWLDVIFRTLYHPKHRK